MKPLVTVGVCVRNGEAMLKNALASIANQNFPKEKLQVIFVDDGSQDSTPKIIQQFLPQFYAPKFFQGAWRGLGAARNLVVNNADGEYVLFVDADEVLGENYVESQIDVFEHNQRVGITAGVFKMVAGNLILNLEVIPFIVNQKTYGKPKSFIWKTDKLIGTGGTAFRLKALRQVKGFDEKIKGSTEDTDLVLRIKKAGWLFQPNNAELFELHGGLSKPRDLWKKYFWYGYGCQRTHRQTGEAFSVPRNTPIAGLVAGVVYSFPAYRLLRKKQVFLLPMHFSFKLTAWMFGFIKGQLIASKN